MVAREPLVVCGIEFAERAFHELSSAVKIKRVAVGQTALQGRAATMLKIAGPDARRFDSGTCRFEFCATTFRCGDGDGEICRSDERHESENSRYAQNDAGLAAV